MPEGMDTSSDCSTVAKTILSEGESFVGRYYPPAYGNHHLNKRRLAKREALRINHLHAVAGWLRLGVLRTPL
jgi:hypothetical protein